jgi:hypothetical protein
VTRVLGMWAALQAALGGRKISECASPLSSNTVQLLFSHFILEDYFDAQEGHT